MPPNSADLGPGIAVQGRAAEICAVVERDADGLRRVIARKVRAICRAMRGDEAAERAVELLGEAVGRALAKPENLDPHRSVSAWLVGTAILILKDQTRRRDGPRRPVPGTDLGDDAWEAILEQLSCAPTDAAVADRIDLQQALGRLDPRSRQVLECRFLRGLDGEDLAEALGARSAGAARVRVSRALKRLREQFGLAGPEVSP